MNEFIEAVEKYLMEVYCIAINDITDNEQLEAFKDGEDPEEFVEWLADKYDLIRFY